MVLTGATCAEWLAERDATPIAPSIPSAPPAQPPSQAAVPTATARPLVTTMAEVSRHPNDMPRSSNYTLYENGKFSREVERTGPLTIEAHLTVKEGVAQIVNGTGITVWTFDGGIPGPMLRGRVGDTLDFYLHNPDTNKIPHNVDFHAVTGPGGGAVALGTKPGEVSHLQVKLLNPGIYIYHCATPDIPMHISQGMYGLIVVEPEEGLPAVDHEFYVMQHEYYTEKGGEEGYQALADKGYLQYSNKYGNLEEPTFVMFNGRPEAAMGDRAMGTYEGVKVKTGETVRLFVGNIGPNLVSSFHVIGEVFDKVYVEGSFDLVNKNIQTTLVPAGGATGVEFTLEVPGNYILVDHSIFRIHKGAIAVIAVEGEDNPEVYHPIKSSEGVMSGH
ncbi:MAG: nitrite reductase, copper-containing [SAR202 cluster bacterium]|nr:nitrite reductase, copper-containing [SAR202 cluster bacterium]